MESLGTLLLWAGFVVSVIGAIWIIVLAFQESLVWGLLCLIIAPVQLIFGIMNWSEAKVPFLMQIGGGILYFIGLVLVAPTIE